MTKSAAVMGLDLSLTATGICVIHGPGKDGFVSETVKTEPKDGSLFERCGYILVYVKQRAEQWRPERVLIEGIFFQQRAPKWDPRKGFGVRPRGDKTAKDLWTLHNIVSFDLGQKMGIPVTVVPPSSLKKFATGNGKASKDMVMRAVQVQWGVDFQGRDNEADAYVLARMGLAALQEVEGEAEAPR